MLNYVILAIIWEFLYIFYLPPTKVPPNLFYTCNRANFFRKHAKLNNIKSAKSSGLRPEPLLTFLDISGRGAYGPPMSDRVKVDLKNTLSDVYRMREYDSSGRPNIVVFLIKVPVFGVLLN